MKKTVSTIVLTGAILLSSTFSFAQAAAQIGASSTVNFKDISGHWAETSIEMLTKKGAIPFSRDEFMPGKAITKSEFAVMLHNALDIQIAYLVAPNIKDYFNDVKQDATYATALIDLVSANIIEGKGSFKPEATLSREEMVHYIMNAYKYKMGDKFVYIKIKGGFFIDHNDIMPIYSGDVDLAAYSKLISGAGKNLFHPKSNSTRAEAAVVISKLVKLVENQNTEVVIKPSVSVKDTSIEMKLAIINNSKNSVTFNHSSGQKFDFVLLGADKSELYRWSEGKVFTMMLTNSNIEAGKSIEYSEVLDGDQYKAIKDKIVYLKAYVIGSSDSLIINADGYELKLK